MALGRGKYDPQLTAALRACGAKQGILIVVDGDQGEGFAAQLTAEWIPRTSRMLRSLADQIDGAAKRCRTAN